MNKLKIGSKEYELKNYYKSMSNNRPSVVFSINANYSEIKPLIIEGQTYFAEMETQTGQKETIDLSSECILFEKLTDFADGSSELTMANYSELEKANQNVSDLMDIVSALSE